MYKFAAADVHLLTSPQTFVTLATTVLLLCCCRHHHPLSVAVGLCHPLLSQPQASAGCQSLRQSL
jgi:hypothetical protein